MAKAEKVFEFEGSRNLNTTPIDITGLQGDKYDYELIMFFEPEGLQSFVTLNFNNDATVGNYRWYYMDGNASTASAFTNDSDNAVQLISPANTKPCLINTSITGESGDERKVKAFCGFQPSTENVRVSDHYWKNTVDEITSIQIKKTPSVTSNCHIILYRVLKDPSQGNWEKIGTLSWSSESSEKSFTGLDGDRDKKYRLVWNGDQEFNVELNNDNASNYTRQYLRNNGGTIQSNNTSESSIVTDGINADILINSESGIDRLISLSSSNTSAVQQNKRAVWWGNTVDNITSIDCTPSSSTTGTATLYRMKSGLETDGILSWELVDTHFQIGTNFSSGYTFSNLTGDGQTLYRIECFIENTTADHEIRLQFNSDTGSNYDRQYLRGQSSSTSAASGTTTYIEIAELGNADVSSSNTIIYPKSGDDRVLLSDISRGEDRKTYRAAWWGNTVDEITSIKIFASSTAGVLGTFKLWRLK